jgi:hypothetical protein
VVRRRRTPNRCRLHGLKKSEPTMAAQDGCFDQRTAIARRPPSLAVYIEKANMDQQRAPHLFEGLDLPRLCNPSALN